MSYEVYECGHCGKTKKTKIRDIELLGSAGLSICDDCWRDMITAGVGRDFDIDNIDALEKVAKEILFARNQKKKKRRSRKNI